MKAKRSILVSLIAILAASFTAQAYDFQEDELYLNIVSEEDATVEIAYSHRYGTDYINNVFEIPATVEHNGKTYEIVGIETGAFRDNGIAYFGVSDDNKYLKAVNGYLYSKDCTKLIAMPRRMEYNSYYYGYTNPILETVREIGDYAFYCIDYADQFDTSNITKIGKHAFERCASDRLKTIKLAEGMTEIPDSAFFNSRISSIEIPSSVTRIGNGAFEKCGYLASVELPENLSHVGDLAFMKTKGFTNLKISKNLTHIGDGAFSAVGSLTSYEVDPENPSYKVKNGMLMSKDETELLSLPSKEGDSFVVPDGVKKIGGGLFYRAPFSTVTFPNSVTEIGSYAFCGSRIINCDLPKSLKRIGVFAYSSCDSLRTIVVPDSVTFIGRRAFENTWNLESIKLSESLETLEDHMFESSNIHSLVIPNSVKIVRPFVTFMCFNLNTINIGNSVEVLEFCAFDVSRTYELWIPRSMKSIGSCATGPAYILHLENEVPIDLDETDFVMNWRILYVPKGCVDAYKNAPVWRLVETIVEEGTDISSIDDVQSDDVRVFSSCGSIVVRGAAEGSPILVYGINGRLMASGTETQIEVPSGIYVVIVNGKSYKVVNK